MIRCSRCGCETPRLTVKQTRCPMCQRAVDNLIALDERRKVVRFPARDLTPWERAA